MRRLTYYPDEKNLDSSGNTDTTDYLMSFSLLRWRFWSSIFQCVERNEWEPYVRGTPLLPSDPLVYLCTSTWSTVRVTPGLALRRRWRSVRSRVPKPTRTSGQWLGPYRASRTVGYSVSSFLSLFGKGGTEKVWGLGVLGTRIIVPTNYGDSNPVKQCIVVST